jgi:hypothetical protein
MWMFHIYVCGLYTPAAVNFQWHAFCEILNELWAEGKAVLLCVSV